MNQPGQFIGSRLRDVLDLMIPAAREEAGRHEYDGQIQDLSSAGVSRAVARLGGTPLADEHDEAHLRAFEQAHRVRFIEVQEHRTNPLLHLSNLELACYDRDYAPTEERTQALRRHLAKWPEAVDIAITTLDQVRAPVAQSLTEAVIGLAAGVSSEFPEAEAALQAHARLVEHIEMFARDGDPRVAIGSAQLASLMGAGEAMPVNLDDLAVRAKAEQERLHDLLSETCAQLHPEQTTAAAVAMLLADHPSADQVIADAAELTEEVIDWTRERSLVPHLDGECVVGESPPSRRWATAMLTWAAPGEPDSPSRYEITPPNSAWPTEQQHEWLSMFNRTAMPPITVHEVAPGHFAHGRSLRHAPTEVRRNLISAAFTEGWAHYAEEMLWEEGFHDFDPRYGIGVCLEALCRVTRLSCAIDLHVGEIDVAEASRRFERQAFLAPQVARSEAQRGTFDPCYGIYTWGKWAILRIREEARRSWGSDFNLPRFHKALLALGAPPLGLLSSAFTLDRLRTLE